MYNKKMFLRNQIVSGLNWLLAVLFLINFTVSFGQDRFNNNELAGFALGQYRACVKRELGPCLQRINTDDGWIYEFHKFRSDTSVYGLFKYAVWDTLRIQSIQINGYRFDEMRPFLGLKLGDPESKVNDALGVSNRMEMIENPTVRVKYYENKNYSVEIDEKGNLYGIQISREKQSQPKESLPSIIPFQKAVLSENIDSVILLLAPDVEIYKNGETITYTKSVRSEFKDKESPLVKILFEDRNSLRNAFLKNKVAPTPELRLYTERVTHSKTSTVYKFYHNKIISEVVFIPEDGQWKVYEISFK